jgi:hypothetical protein
MSEPPLQAKLGPSIQNLVQRHELFQLIQNSHLRWMYETDDQNIKELHRAIADHLQAVVVQYQALLDALQCKHEL